MKVNIIDKIYSNIDCNTYNFSLTLEVRSKLSNSDFKDIFNFASSFLPSHNSDVKYNTELTVDKNKYFFHLVLKIKRELAKEDIKNINELTFILLPSRKLSDDIPLQKQDEMMVVSPDPFFRFVKVSDGLSRFMGNVSQQSIYTRSLLTSYFLLWCKLSNYTKDLIIFIPDSLRSILDDTVSKYLEEDGCMEIHNVTAVLKDHVIGTTTTGPLEKLNTMQSHIDEIKSALIDNSKPIDELIQMWHSLGYFRIKRVNDN